MIVAITGHRPDKLGGYHLPIKEKLIAHLRSWLQQSRPDKALSGMALGIDQIFAEACILESVPFVAAIPAIWQSDRWPRESRIHYQSLLDRAADVVVVCGPDVNFYTAMQLRNEWLVDNCDQLWCVWDGSKGGTRNCLEYALQEYGCGKITRSLNPCLLF